MHPPPRSYCQGTAVRPGGSYPAEALAKVSARPVRSAEHQAIRCGQEDDRRELLQLSEAQLGDVVRFCNRYPDIQMAHQVLDPNNVRAGQQARGS